MQWQRKVNAYSRQNDSVLRSSTDSIAEESAKIALED